jgi:hypothetical protein
MQYRYEVKSLVGFVQFLASNILPHGYWFYVTGRVPGGKDPRAVDQKLIAKYGIGLSRQQRARRKLSGLSNLHYIRLGRFWALLATHGEHAFFQDEGERVRDIRKTPLQLGGYSLTIRRGGFLKRMPGDEKAMVDGKYRVRVQIGREHYRELKAYFLDIATHRSSKALEKEFQRVAFEPYAPIRKQLLNLLRLVNSLRTPAGYTKVPITALRLRRQIVRPFGEETDKAAA